MADKKLSDEPTLDNTTIDTADLIYVADVSASQTKGITNANLMAPKSSTFRVVDSSDTTKKVALNVSGVTTATTRTLTVPDANTTIVGTDTTQTLTGKTLGSNTKINTTGSDTTGSMYYRASDGSVTPFSGTSSQIVSFNSSGIPEAIPNPAAADASTSVKGVVEIATTAQINAGTSIGETGAVLAVSPDGLLASAYKQSVFGGDGSDGALVISSGTTTIDLAGAAVFIKNYSSISITGTGVLAFINPASGGTVIILKSREDVTLTSSSAPMIDCSGLGAAGGAGGSGDNDGSDGTVATDILGADSSNGKGGLKRSSAADTTGGAVYTLKPFYSANADRLNTRKSLSFTAGSGGGGGGTGASGTGGSGGRGGGGLVIQCGGTLNFTTANGISVAGKPGSAGTTSSDAGCGGGGGGAGGFAFILYNSLTAVSGTVNVSGGSGGSGSNAIGGNAGGRGGSGGGMYAGAGGIGGRGGVTSSGGIGSGTSGGTGTNSAATGSGGGAGGLGGNNSATGGGGGGGGGGAAGEYFIAKNQVWT